MLSRTAVLKVSTQFEQRLRGACEQIIAGVRAGRATTVAAEWLLENYSYLRSQVREIRESMPAGFYRRLPKARSGVPSIFELARQATSTLETMDADSIRKFFGSHSEHSEFLLAELWAIRTGLKVALLEQLDDALVSGPLESEMCEQKVKSAITAFREMESIKWPELVESLCHIDRMLRQDPVGAYSRMDFETRDRYRREVEEIARHSHASESQVATGAIELARASDRHVGWYLVDRGVSELRHRVRSRLPFLQALKAVVLRIPLLTYLGAICTGIALLLIATQRFFGPLPLWFLALLILPASQAALVAVNLLVSYALRPQLLPRLDFRGGIPADSRTAVVVPTLLLSRDGIHRLVENLEIYYLANQDSNLMFGLLTDFPDSDEEDCGKKDLLEVCADGINDLNRRHGKPGQQPFFLLHRSSQWNSQEGKWMGRERKRGKLEDFNALLLGNDHRFSVTVGDVKRLEGTRYVITLDSDTQLPRDTAWKLVGSMAHPLNRPVFDERTGIVTAGYSLLQPRIGISMESASKSNLAALLSGNTGFDPYTRAVSDVYQDLFGRATFTGKGIYDVAAFERATHGRFAENTLLSHDLIEGEHVRAGLVTDLEMVDDYPARYQAWSKRKHRWVRGDWQIVMWLLPRVPDASWRWVPNVLPWVSRWKIFDNLRRSLVEVFAALALLSALVVPAVNAVEGILAVLALFLFPVYAELVVSFLRPPPMRFLRAWVWTRISDFSRGHLDALFTLLFLPMQGLLMVDAIVRTLYRRIVSRKNLLEWESMAAVEMAKGSAFQASQLLTPRGGVALIRSWNLAEIYLAISTGIAALCWWLLIRSADGASALAFALVLGWASGYFLVLWLNSAATHTGADNLDRAFLRSVSLSTWRFFYDHGTEEENWLVPDNIQEDPPAHAYRTSPTNVGLQLNAFHAAHEFGYLTHHEFAERSARVLHSVDRMERYRGHLYNWYDTRTLGILPPSFVSTVDSGNLAASLIVTRQAALALQEAPVVEGKMLLGLLDHLARLRDILPVSARTTSIVRKVESLSRLLNSKPDDLFFWEGVLSEAHTLALDLHADVEWSASRLAVSAPELAGEVRYWLNAFVSRADASLRHLCNLAPWLCGPLETEMRLNLSNTYLAKLLEHLRRIPRLSELPSVYEAISKECIRLEADAHIHASTRATLATLRSSLDSALVRQRDLYRALADVASVSSRLHDDMDFSFLLDRERHLLRIGWNGDNGKVENSCYDLLASEARTAVFVAIAKGDAPLEAWFHLGRKLTYYRGHRTLLSWSGTMFEYLMPALFMNTWPSTLLGESVRSVIDIQKLYARERRIPWGISESAHSGRDGALNYQYRAFGVPCCGMQRVQPDDLVIAPYATALSLMVKTDDAAANLRNMAARGWLARYGFYEAIDFRRRIHGYRRPEVIRAFMAHHQGMSLLSLANVLLDNPVRKMFHSHPLVLATELLLQERMPVMVEANAPEQPFPGLLPQSEQLETAGELQTVVE